MEKHFLSDMALDWFLLTRNICQMSDPSQFLAIDNQLFLRFRINQYALAIWFSSFKWHSEIVDLSRFFLGIGTIPGHVELLMWTKQTTLTSSKSSWIVIKYGAQSIIFLPIENAKLGSKFCWIECLDLRVIHLQNGLTIYRWY
jgi:hypothetical protein